VKHIAKLFMGLAVVLGASVYAGTAEDQIAERLKKVGELCLQGEDCASAAPATTMAAASGFDVKATYDTTCATCHNVGVAGAPKLGDKAGWEPRLAQGMDVLYDHGINGLAPAMPAKGMCFTCSDDDIKALVDYMVDSVK
jgi:cytochrome c5